MATQHSPKKDFSVVIVGGGAGGTAVAARLLRAQPQLDVAVIDPAEYHYYQPAWTLVGGGTYRVEDTQRRMVDCLPKRAYRIQAEVTALDPENNQVTLADGQHISYKYLVVAAGIQTRWDKIKGLEAAIGHDGVTSNYSAQYAPYTWKLVEQFKGGKAIFTQPAGAIKCPGAPQKALYLSADYFKKQHIPAELEFRSAGASIFGVPFYAESLDKIMASYQADAHYKNELIEVKGEQKIAVFKVTEGDAERIEEVSYDLLHVVPPQQAPEFIKNSPLANEGGWLDVHKHTLQNVKFDNVFGLGDCTSTPNSKTAAAVKSQAPVLAQNLLSVLQQRDVAGQYEGYAACPLTTSRGKVLLAEFSYGGKITPSFPGNPQKPKRFFWWLKRSFMPYLYWNHILKGKSFPIKTLKRHKVKAQQSQTKPV